jgi:hypothetical protein
VSFRQIIERAAFGDLQVVVIRLQSNIPWQNSPTDANSRSFSAMWKMRLSDSSITSFARNGNPLGLELLLVLLDESVVHAVDLAAELERTTLLKIWHPFR